MTPATIHTTAARPGIQLPAGPAHHPNEPEAGHAHSTTRGWCPMTRTTLPRKTKTNPVGTVAATRTAHRLHAKAAETETAGDIASAATSRAHAWLNGLPLETWRWTCRHHDYTAGIAASVLFLASCALLRLLDASGLPVPISTPFVALGANAGRILPTWLTAVIVGTVVGYLHWQNQHRTAHRHRTARRHAAPITNVLRPAPGITGRYDDNPWRQVDTLTVPQGHTPHQYIEKAPVLATALRQPVRITSTRPGEIVVRRQLIDILARPVPFQPADSDLIPIGINDDALWQLWNPHGASLLVAGMKGSGKSALLKAVCVNLYERLYPTSLIDLEGGPNFGKFKPFATNCATTINEALELLDHLNAEREANLLALCHPDAPDAATKVSHVLVVDELAMLTHQSRPHANRARAVLDDMLARGRKPGFTVIAATQYPETAVLPTLLRGQFSQILGLRTAHRPETNVILGTGALGEGWDLSAIAPNHQGRGLWWDGSTITPIRAAGLYGDTLRTAIKQLTDRQRAAIDATSTPSPTHDVTVTTDTPTPTKETEKQPTASQIQDHVREAAVNAGPVGIRVQAIADKHRVSTTRVRRACIHWRDRSLMRTDGTRWYWEGGN